MTGLTQIQLQAILAHELAHMRRHDYLVNLLQTAVETVLFYRPGGLEEVIGLRHTSRLGLYLAYS